MFPECGNSALPRPRLLYRCSQGLFKGKVRWAARKATSVNCSTVGVELQDRSESWADELIPGLTTETSHRWRLF
jgi:hypothetical protein